MHIKEICIIYQYTKKETIQNLDSYPDSIFPHLSHHGVTMEGQLCCIYMKDVVLLYKDKSID